MFSYDISFYQEEKSDIYIGVSLGVNAPWKLAHFGMHFHLEEPILFKGLFAGMLVNRNEA
jgi:hypothetical protein